MRNQGELTSSCAGSAPPSKLWRRTRRTRRRRRWSKGFGFVRASLRWFYLRGSEFSYGFAVLISLHDLLFPVPDHNNEGGSIAVSFILCRLFLIANTAFAPSRGRFPSRTRLFAIKASLPSRSAGPIPKTKFQADGCVIRESQGNLGIRQCRVPWAVSILNREVPSTQASLHLPTHSFIT